MKTNRHFFHKEKNMKNFFYNDHPVRLVTDTSGVPWWVAADVCAILEIANVSQAVAALDDDEKGICKIYTHGGPQEMITVNESGLYTLILRSSKPEAKPFRRWITHEVLPSIRKTGAYQAKPKPKPKRGSKARTIRFPDGEVITYEPVPFRMYIELNSLKEMMQAGVPRVVMAYEMGISMSTLKRWIAKLTEPEPCKPGWLGLSNN